MNPTILEIVLDHWNHLRASILTSWLKANLNGVVIEAYWGVIIASASALPRSVVRTSKNVLSRRIELGTVFDYLRLSFAVVVEAGA